MTLQLDTLIAIAFIAPVAFFVVLDIVVFRTRGYAMAVRPAIEVTPVTEMPGSAEAEAANDAEVRIAA